MLENKYNYRKRGNKSVELKITTLIENNQDDKGYMRMDFVLGWIKSGFKNSMVVVHREPF